MKEHLNEGWLNDFWEGSLSDEETQQVRTHLEGCSACRSELERLTQLGAALEELPQEAQPPRDLWPAVALRIGQEGRTVGSIEPAHGARVSRSVPAIGRARRPAWRLLAAGLAVALVSGGSVWLLLSGGAGPTDPIARAPVETLATPAGLEEALSSYDESVSGLEAILAEGRGVLDDETVRVLEENLTIINGAISEARGALSQDPGSRVLGRLLVESLRRKVTLLKYAAVAVKVET